MKFELKLIDNIRSFYKIYSLWFFTIILALPDIYNQAIAAGIITQDKVPNVFTQVIRVIALLGLASRVVKQKNMTAVDPASVGAPTPGIAVLSPVPANVQAAMDQNTSDAAKPNASIDSTTHL